LALLGSLSIVVVFGIGAGRLGFYSDDVGFLTTLPHYGLAATLNAAWAYVPGRNLHIIWQQLLYLVGGTSPADLGTQHVFQSLLDSATVAIFYLLMRKLRAPRLWAVFATGAFAFYPNHGETHFWLSSGPMNVMSTLFLLLFAYAASAAAERVRTARRQAPDWLLAAELVLFVLALFTYDQVFFVLMFILALRATQIILLRRRPAYVVMGFTAAYIGIIIFYVVRKQHPQSGPTLTHVSVSHVWSNVRLSVRESFGPLFRQQLDSLTQNLTRSVHLTAVAVVLGFAAVSLLLLVRTVRGFLALRTRRLTTNPFDEVAGISVRRAFTLVGIGVAAYFLAYLPADLWYFSPRHHFLPTAGLALALGAAGATLSAVLRYVHPLVPLLLAVGAVVAGGLILVRFVEAGLSEKRYWQESYQLRQNLYGQIAKRDLLAGKTAVVYVGFPPALGPAPYFEQENQLALNYLYPTQASLTMSSISTLESDAGYYLYTEVNRYGPASVRFLPRDKVLRVTYLSQTEKTVRFSTTRRLYSTSRFYTVARLPRTDGSSPATNAVRDAHLLRNVGRTRLSLDVDLTPGAVANLGDLAVVLEDNQGTPWTTAPNGNGDPMIIPIRLTDRAAARPRMRFVVTLRAPIPSNFRDLTLYSLSTDLPRALAMATASS